MLVILLDLRLRVTTGPFDTFIFGEILFRLLSRCDWLDDGPLASVAFVAITDTNGTLHDTVAVLALLIGLMLLVDLMDDGAFISLKRRLQILGLSKAFVGDAQRRCSIQSQVILRLYNVVVDQFDFLCGEGALLVCLGLLLRLFLYTAELCC